MDAEQIYNAYFGLIVRVVKSRNYLFYKGKLTQHFEDITHSIFLYLCENMPKESYEIEEVYKMIATGFDKYKRKNRPRCCTNYYHLGVDENIIINSTIYDNKTDGIAQEIEQIIDWSNKEEYDNQKKRK